RIAIAGHRLARPLPDWAVAARAGVHGPLLGPGIAALAAPHGPRGGSPESARLGIDDRSQGDRASRHRADARADALARAVQISAAGRRRLSDRHDPDRRGFVWPVGRDTARRRAQYEPGARGLPDDIFQS